jgi:anti-sigma regulatory factor (Ser/Thr protein kinase)
MSMLTPQPDSAPAFDVVGGVHAPAAARHAVIGVLEGELGPEALLDAELLVSEVVTNAVLHGGAADDASIGVVVDLLPDRIRVAVTDPGDGFERPKSPTARPDAAGGNGLVLLEQLASDWDVERGEQTVVWFELERQSRRLQSPPELSFAC